MKKYLWLFTALLSNSLFAQQENMTAETSPMLRLAVYDTSGGKPKEIGLKYSRSNPHLQLCWMAFNMPFLPENEVIQSITAPTQNIKYDGIDQTRITIANDGKTATIKQTLAAPKEDFLHQCFKYDETEPLGKYELDIRINHIQFKTVEFELIK